MASLQDYREEEQEMKGALRAPLLAAAPDEAGVYIDCPAHSHLHLGGWKCASCIIGAHMLGCMSFNGISLNLVVYLIQVCNQTSAAAANIVTTVSGTSLLCSLLGAFVSDAYLGRLWSVLIFHSLTALGSALISSAVIMISQGGATATAISFLLVSLYFKGINGGPLLPNLISLGADQLSSIEEKEKYFRLFTISSSVGQLLAVTGVTYIDNMGMWVWGFLVCSAGSVAGLALVAGAAKWFRQYKVTGNPLLRNFQVLVAACRKCSLNLPEDSSLLYECQGNLSAIPGCRNLKHTATLRFYT